MEARTNSYQTERAKRCKIYIFLLPIIFHIHLNKENFVRLGMCIIKMNALYPLMHLKTLNCIPDTIYKGFMRAAAVQIKYTIEFGGFICERIYSKMHYFYSKI